MMTGGVPVRTEPTRRACVMVFRMSWFIIVLSLLAAGCRGVATPVSTGQPAPTPTLPGPVEGAGSLPDASAAARVFLDAWQADDYAAMYARLTSISKDIISLDEFEEFFSSIATEMALDSLEYEIRSALVMSARSAQVSYRIVFHSTLIGDIRRDTLMSLSLEQDQWFVQWESTLVMPELAEGSYLRMERYIPARANIYDRNGHALVAQADATAIGLIPNQIDPGQEAALFERLTELTGLSADQIRLRYAGFPSGEDWYLPLTEVVASQVAPNFEMLSGFKGLVLSPYKARYYFDGGVAAHVLGYVTTIQAGQEDEYLRRGYRLDERVGQSGLEQWGEEYLSGERGGALYVFNSKNEIVTRLAERQARPAQAIYTTLDRDFQKEVERAISGFRGAVVVLERDTGRVLAMASSPGFDPNAFEPANRNSADILTRLFSDPNTPTFNRATQGQYPPGSIFKVITMSAALDDGSYTPETPYQCGYTFTELDGVTLYDWTYEHYRLDGTTIPSGLLTLSEGLMRSCNPYFFHIGLDLYNQDKTQVIANMARAFGLGKPTGIQGVSEAAGNVPEPASEIDATNLAIGQGETLVTPLQVAAFMAALGNGGTLYRPQVIERVAPPDGEATIEFKPEVNARLPLSAENLKAVQDALRGVVVSTQPYGTAWHRFTGLDIPVSGKTGTAQSGSDIPHAWFAGYTFAGRSDLADIAVAVVVENIGEGSDYAAPIFRRVIELYFYDRPTRLYPWESGFYVVPTAEPEPSETPQP